jgi:uncharacterized membrane protein
VKVQGPARKMLLTVHIATSVGWYGAILAYIALNVPLVSGAEEQMQRGSYLMMRPVLLYVIVPLAITSTATGIVQALATPWGLFKHYWVSISLWVTIFATTILIAHIPAVNALAAMAADPSADVTAHGADLFHSVGGLLVLTVPLILNVAKPRGLTRAGWRAKQASA